jgi:hypothetical protein
MTASVPILLIRLLTNRLTFDRLNLTDAEQRNYGASVGRAVCDIRNDINQKEKSVRCPRISRMNREQDAKIRFGQIRMASI